MLHSYYAYIIISYTHVIYIYIIYIYIYIICSYSFYNKLNTNPRYLAHQFNICIDNLIGILLLIEDLFFDHMHKEVMKGNGDSIGEASLKKDGNERYA